MEQLPKIHPQEVFARPACFLVFTAQALRIIAQRVINQAKHYFYQMALAFPMAPVLMAPSQIIQL